MAYGKGKRQATLGFHVKKWLSQGIGDPTPIQFSDKGQIIFVCRKMDKIPEIEKELRDKIDSVRSKKNGAHGADPYQRRKNIHNHK